MMETTFKIKHLCKLAITQPSNFNIQLVDVLLQDMYIYIYINRNTGKRYNIYIFTIIHISCRIVASLISYLYCATFPIIFPFYCCQACQLMHLNRMCL